MEQIESTDPEDRRSTNKNGTHEPGKRNLRDEAAVASFELVPGATRTVMARFDKLTSIFLDIFISPR